MHNALLESARLVAEELALTTLRSNLSSVTRACHLPAPKLLVPRSLLLPLAILTIAQLGLHAKPRLALWVSAAPGPAVGASPPLSRGVIPPLWRRRGAGN